MQVSVMAYRDFIDLNSILLFLISYLTKYFATISNRLLQYCQMRKNNLYTQEVIPIGPKVKVDEIFIRSAHQL